MKKILLFLTLISLVTTIQAQCLKTLNALKNGAGNKTYPGFGNPGDDNYEAPDNSYKISGQIQVSLTTPLTADVYPPALITVVETYPVSQTFDYKYAVSAISTDRKTITYDFYGNKNSQNLPNGSQVKYTVTIKYAGKPLSICTEVENISPLQTLPVLFKAFEVTRKNANTIGLSWVTASEQNNRGFYVQRNDGQDWKNIAFVFSAADFGNSSTEQRYEYKDVNTAKVSKYRIQQVDMDGKVSFSEVKAVQAESASAKLLVYPNPTSNGKVNVVFENNDSLNDIIVNDVSGRTISYYRNIANNNVSIENLKTGFYTIKVTNQRTSSSIVEKVLVK